MVKSRHGGERIFGMLKIAVFDSGYGGEIFADRLEQELPVVEVIRVIDWRHAEDIQSSPRCARKCAELALRSYIGKVDLIIFANHLLSVTSLKYFKRKYKNQHFLGLELELPCSFTQKDILILATKALTRTLAYRQFLSQLRPSHVKTLVPESWPLKIDDGELKPAEVLEVFQRTVLKNNFHPTEIVIACSQFNDITPTIQQILGRSVKFCDGTREVFSDIYKILRIRGRGKKRY